MTYVQKPQYVVDFNLTGNHDFAPIWASSVCAISFQLQWEPALAAGVFSIYASNQDLPIYGKSSDVVYPPILKPANLLSFDVGIPPFDTNKAGTLEVAPFAFGWCWIHYEGIGGGKVSIAYHGKSYA